MLTLNLAAYLKAVESRKHEIEHHKIRRSPLHKCDAGWPIVGNVDGVSLVAQSRSNRLGDRYLIFDYGNPRRPVCHEVNNTDATSRSGRYRVEKPCRFLMTPVGRTRALAARL